MSEVFATKLLNTEKLLRKAEGPTTFLLGSQVCLGLCLAGYCYALRGRSRRKNIIKNRWRLINTGVVTLGFTGSIVSRMALKTDLVDLKTGFNWYKIMLMSTSLLTFQFLFLEVRSILKHPAPQKWLIAIFCLVCLSPLLIMTIGGICYYERYARLLKEDVLHTI